MPPPPLSRYRNHAGDSGVIAYALLDDGIIVKFLGGSVYLYGPRQPGPHHVLEMKRRALAGRGLCTYISRHVGENYEARLR